MLAELNSNGYRRLRQLTVEVDDDTVTLAGQLDTFYLSQLAQEAASRSEGVVYVVNNIEVEGETR